jgi:hypothetical protein
MRRFFRVLVVVAVLGGAAEFAVDLRAQSRGVVEHWSTAHSWLVPPVMVAREVLGTNIGYELLVGYTRLGNLLGLLDRQEIPEVQRHLVWVGNVRLPAGS